MAEYLRQLNPQLAAAMTDERDEVLVILVYTGLEHILHSCITSCCLQGFHQAAYNHPSPQALTNPSCDAKVILPLQFMFRKLQHFSGRSVGVVGLAHLDGIEHRWEKWQSRPRNPQLS